MGTGERVNVGVSVDGMVGGGVWVLDGENVAVGVCDGSSVLVRLGMPVGVNVLVGLGVCDGTRILVGGEVAVTGRIRVGVEVRKGVSPGVSVGATVGVTCGTARLQAGSSHASSASQKIAR